MKTKLTFQWLLYSCFLAISLQLQAQTQLGNTLTGNPGDNSGYAVALNDAGTVKGQQTPGFTSSFAEFRVSFGARGAVNADSFQILQTRG